MFDMKTTVRPTPLQSLYEMQYGRESEIRQMLCRLCSRSVATAD
jgi:hypothetical protein